MTTVRTRFAPSPTGYMHIGGMRTALFNWLWARHNHGAFILRIDDTDRQRHVESALEPILQAFRWLDLDWDEGPEVGGEFGPYFQSQRGEIYQAACDRLLAEGKAYRDFDSPEIVQADRAAAEREKRPYLNVRRSLDLSDSEIAQFLDEGRAYVVRFVIPRNEKVGACDAVRGDVEWDCSLLPDPVIMRGDGSPLYNFATVVDDAAMQITHVIRAEEHLSNLPVQLLIHRALGNELPEFAHIPFVTAPGTSRKLSKRDLGKYRNNPQFRKMFEAADRVFPKIGLEVSESLNPVMVEYYEKIGYLPAGVLNALARLGWSLDDQTEIMSRQTIVENFTLRRIVKNPAGLDPDKLLSYQVHWMNQLPIDEKVAGCWPYLERAGYVRARNDESADRVNLVSRLIGAMGDRLKIFSDVLDYDEFFVADADLTYDEKAFKKRVCKEGAAERLAQFRQVLAEADPFTSGPLETTMKSFVDAEEIKLGEIIHAVRVAVTGKATGIGMFDCLELLGKERCLTRIDRTLSRV